ncbi:MAG: T9SS type A sorting domain-containing protein [Bacteroidetes bacterium]|nr:T9SS type A sorting domain-containing protein [Bacteroidota bacterium]
MFAIYDLLSRERIKTNFDGLVNKAIVNVSGLETGVYLYVLQKQDQTTFTGKLIIE